MKRILALALLLPLAALSQSKSRPQRVVVCTGGGTASAATCAPSPALTALSDLSTTPRTLVSFTPTANNTGALTLSPSGLAATPVVKYVGGAAVALAANDVRANTSYMLEYDGTNFVVKSVLGNGGSGGGTGDVVGPSSATNNAIVVFDGTTGKLVKNTTCTIVSGVLTCTGGVTTGDGTANAMWEMPELTANGANKQTIYGAANQSADGCVVWPVGNPTVGQVLTDSGSSATIDAKTCRVLSWGSGSDTTTVANSGTSGASVLKTSTNVTARKLVAGANVTITENTDDITIAASGGGGGATYADCPLTSNCAHTALTGRGTPPASTANQVRLVRIVVPGATTLKSGSMWVRLGGAAESAIFSIWTDSSGVPGTLVANSEIRFTDLSSAGFRTGSFGSINSGTGAFTAATTPATLSAGTYWLAYATESSTAEFLTMELNFGSTISFLPNFTAKPGYVSAANAATNPGSTYRFPATLGTLTALTNQSFFPVFVSSSY